MTIKICWYQENMFLPRKNIAFGFTENTRLNRMRYYILFLPSRENKSFQKITWSNVNEDTKEYITAALYMEIRKSYVNSRVKLYTKV